MQTFHSIAFASLGLLAVASAELNGQTKVVIPSGYQNTEGNIAELRPFAYDRIRLTQYIGINLLRKSIPFRKTITAIAYRRDGRAFTRSTFTRRTSPTWTIRMGNYFPTTSNPKEAYLRPGTGSFNSLTTVFNAKTVNFPKLGPVGFSTPPFNIRFPLDAPFQFLLTGGYLAIDHFAYETRYRISTYLIDAVRSQVDVGTATSYGTACPQGKNRAFGISSNPGSEFPLELRLFGGVPNSLLIGTFGISKTKWNGVPLPLDLGFLGLTGCKIYASEEIMIPVKANTNGGAAIVAKLPADPSLAGVNLYSQWISLDKRVNPSFPLSFSNGIAFRIGKSMGNQPPLDAFFTYGESNAARARIGFVDTGISLVTEFTYK
ncbi:MAG TPA: hypothetical protein ENK02_06375 [Planctomycetes bacterium]|nr:hypothetical protein [Planctomycetota bacterium]